MGIHRMSKDQHRGEAGGVPVMTLLILFLATALMLLLTATTEIATHSLSSTARSAANTSAVEEATSAANVFYSEVESDPSWFSSGAYQKFPHYGSWATLSPGGKIRSCPSSSGIGNCFELQAIYTTSSSGAGAPSPAGQSQQAATVTVRARTDCKGSVSSCSSATMVQHLRRRTFLDYLYFTDSNALDPSLASTCSGHPGCDHPAYQGSAASGSDHINGPVRTNGSQLRVCGTPIFDGPVTVTGSLPGWEPSAGAGCAASVPVFTRGIATGATTLPLPTSDSHLQALAAAGGSPWAGQSGYSFSGNLTVAISGHHLVLTPQGGSAQTAPFPQTGVVYASGNVDVSGTNAGQLTIASGGRIDVTGNLTYACVDTGKSIPSSCTDVTGLAATGSIRLHWQNDQNLTVDAAMLSLNHSVHLYAPGSSPAMCPHTGDSGSPVPNCPTLTINGAMATKYRGLFGGYRTTTGQLVEGWHKNFAYDTRLYHLEPPWFLSGTTGEWTRTPPVITAG